MAFAITGRCRSYRSRAAARVPGPPHTGCSLADGPADGDCGRGPDEQVDEGARSWGVLRRHAQANAGVPARLGGPRPAVRRRRGTRLYRRVAGRRAGRGRRHQRTRRQGRRTRRRSFVRSRPPGPRARAQVTAPSAGFVGPSTCQASKPRRSSSAPTAAPACAAPAAGPAGCRPFLDADELGFGTVLVNCLLVAVLFTCLAAGAARLDRTLPGLAAPDRD